MKKIISIICTLLLVFSLTACSSEKSDSKKENAQKQETTIGDKYKTNLPVKEQTISKYINEDSLNNTDNISFLLDSVNDNEYLIVNVKSPDLVKNIKLDNSGMYSDATKINYNSSNIQIGGFNFNFITDGYQTWQSGDSDYEEAIVKQDGCLILVSSKQKNRNNATTYYTLWAKGKNEYICINFTLPGKTVGNLSETQAISAYNTVKECFTFASVGTEIKTQNSVLWEVPDLSRVTLFGEEKTTAVANNWVFLNDLIYKEYQKNGLNFVSSNHLNIECNDQIRYYSNLEYNIKLSDADRDAGLNRDEFFAIQVFPIKKGSSYDMGKTVKEFQIGDLKFKIEGIDPDNNNYILFKIKTQTGAEYSCNILFKTEALENDFEYIQKYLEKIFL